MAGRPSSFTVELAQEILDRLATGEPLAQICRDDGMPSGTTVRNWCDLNLHIPSGEQEISFAIAYARAREDGFDQIAAEALRIADTQAEGVITTTKPDGTIETKAEDMLGHRKLQIDTRLKLLAKWDPKRYGDKTLVGSDPDNPLPQGFTVNLVKGASEAG